MIIAVFERHPGFAASRQRPDALECTLGDRVIHYVGEEPSSDQVMDFIGLSPRAIRERMTTEVKAECGRRIELVYPIHEQLNDPTNEGKQRYKEDMRLCCAALLQMNPIPEDFRADHWWRSAGYTIMPHPGSGAESGFESIPPESNEHHLAPIPEVGEYEADPLWMEEPFEMPRAFRSAGEPMTEPATDLPRPEIHEEDPIIPPLDSPPIVDPPEREPEPTIRDAELVAAMIQAVEHAAEIAIQRIAATLENLKLPKQEASDEQIRYETALRARNGDTEALMLLEPVAQAEGVSILDLANRWVAERKARERVVFARIVNGGRDGTIDGA